MASENTEEEHECLTIRTRCRARQSRSTGPVRTAATASKASYPRSARTAAPIRRCSTRCRCRGFSTLSPTGFACQPLSTLQPSAFACQPFSLAIRCFYSRLIAGAQMGSVVGPRAPDPRASSRAPSSAGASEPFALDRERIDRGRAAKRPLVDRLRPDSRSVDLVGQVRGKWAVGRLARDQPQVRAYAGEQGGTGAEDDGRDVQADLVDEPGAE